MRRRKSLFVACAAAVLVGVLAAFPAAAGDLTKWAARATGGTVLIEAENSRDTRFGSGFFFDRPGLVATALQTVEGASGIRVSIPGRYAASDAKLIAACSTWDLAILAVSWPAEAAFPGLSIESGSSLAIGTEVAVSGYGQIEGLEVRVPLTIRGIVSGRIDHRGGFSYILDVSARPGFSGGPVYRTDNGGVVGVLTRLHANGAGSGSGGATPARALEDLLQSVARAPVQTK